MDENEVVMVEMSLRGVDALEDFISSGPFQVVFSNGRVFTSGKIELERFRDRVLIYFFGVECCDIWHVEDYDLSDYNKAVLKLSRKFGTEKLKAFILKKNDILVRNVIGSTSSCLQAGFKGIKSAAGCRIYLENTASGKSAVIVDENLGAEKLLTKAVLLIKDWIEKREKIGKISLVLQKEQVVNALRLHELLSDFWKSLIEIYELDSNHNIRIPSGDLDNEVKWCAPTKPISNELIRRIISLDSKRIEAVSAGNKTILRFLGLPFAFIDKESIFFGIEKRKRLMSPSLTELELLVEELKKYRSFDSPNKKHLFYTMLPEAWLEFTVKSQIKRLDEDFYVSPVYSQFRVEKNRLDLLAFSSRGEIIIIETKIKPTAEILFQSLSYWLKIEIARRNGAFNGAIVADKPAHIYLVAPELSFHKEIRFLAEAIRRDIQIYVIELDGAWRKELRVVNRYRI